MKISRHDMNVTADSSTIYSETLSNVLSLLMEPHHLQSSSIMRLSGPLQMMTLVLLKWDSTIIEVRYSCPGKTNNKVVFTHRVILCNAYGVL